MADRGPDRDAIRETGTRPHPGERPTDVGRTMGGGSLGHAPASDVESEAPLRNTPPEASSDAGRLRQNHGAGEPGRNADPTGSPDDDVMPADDATLNTKI